MTMKEALEKGLVEEIEPGKYRDYDGNIWKTTEFNKPLLQMIKEFLKTIFTNEG